MWRGGHNYQGAKEDDKSRVVALHPPPPPFPFNPLHPIIRLAVIRLTAREFVSKGPAPTTHTHILLERYKGKCLYVERRARAVAAAWWHVCKNIRGHHTAWTMPMASKYPLFFRILVLKRPHRSDLCVFVYGALNNPCTDASAGIGSARPGINQKALLEYGTRPMHAFARNEPFPLTIWVYLAVLGGDSPQPSSADEGGGNAWATPGQHASRHSKTSRRHALQRCPGRTFATSINVRS